MSLKEFKLTKRLEDDPDYETFALMGELGLKFNHARKLLTKYKRDRIRLVEDVRQHPDWLSTVGD